MKNIICLILVILIALMSSCVEKDESIGLLHEAQDKNLSDNSLEKKDIIDIPILGRDIPDAIRVYHRLNQKFLDSEEQSNYIQYIEDEFGVTLVFMDTSQLDISTFHSANGIVLTYGRELSEIYERRYDLLQPLNNVVNHFASTQLFPEYFVKDLIDNDGNIWAIPARLEVVKKIRLYNDNLMSELNLSPPRSTDEFYDFLAMLSSMDAQRKIMNVNSKNALYDFSDIFNAFGCYFSTDLKTISWNHDTQSYEDLVFQPSFLEALEYIESIRNLEVLSFEEVNNYSEFYDDSLVTFMRHQNGNLITENYSITFADSDAIEDLYYTYNYSYTIPKKTKDYESFLTAFLDVFIGNVEGNLTGFLGVNGASADFTNTAKVKMLSEGSNNGTVAMSWKWQPLNPYIICQDTISSQEVEVIETAYTDYNDWLNTKLNSGKIRTFPIWIEYRTANIRNYNLDNMFNEMFYMFLSSQMSSEEFISEYKRKMENMGGNEYLEQLNKAINGKTKYLYKTEN